MNRARETGTGPRRDPEPEALLSPEFLDGLDDLEWAGRLVARGLARGRHPSLRLGRGEEFDRHRAYQQGDDLRHLDWRLLARTDRLHVRRFRETSNVEIVFLVDASPSMDFAGGEEAVTKLRFAVLLAAALGHVARGSGDLTGLVVTNGRDADAAELLPPRSGQERWRAFLHALTRTAGRPAPPEGGPAARGTGAVSTGSPLTLPDAARTAGDLLPRGGRLVIFSDFLDEPDLPDLVRACAQLGAAGVEVSAVRILTPEELGERGGEDALWHDPERPEVERPGDPSRDSGYVHRLAAYYDDLSRALEEHGVVWRIGRTTDPPVALIREWILDSRVGRAGRAGHGRMSASEGPRR